VIILYNEMESHIVLPIIFVCFFIVLVWICVCEENIIDEVEETRQCDDTPQLTPSSSMNSVHV